MTQESKPQTPSAERRAPSRWPLLTQFLTGSDGTGSEAMTDRTRALRPRHETADVTRSICPYCAVGCGQLIYHQDGKVVSVEGDPESPISEGRLCPKGAATYELLTHAARATRVKYRAPGAAAWIEIDLETAMDMVAERTWASRERHFVEHRAADGVDTRSCSARQSRTLAAPPSTTKRTT